MDTNAILSKLKAAAPSGVLESGRFGRADLFSVWIESSAVQSIAAFAQSDSELRLNWLENFSVAEVGDSFVISWFLRSRENKTALVLRSSFTPAKEGALFDAPSVRSVWQNATFFEDEAAELFGIRFKLSTGEQIVSQRSLGIDPNVYPMRKSFVVRKAESS